MSAPRPDGTDTRVPVVLPQLRIQVDDAGDLSVTLDRAPYDVPADCRGRDAVRRIVDQVATQLGPVRIEVIESDGTVYTDIATPPSPNSPDTAPPPSRHGFSPFEVGGTGFLPDEPVAVAVIVAQQPAGTDGTARLHLPPALLTGRPEKIVLLGRTSGTISVVGPP